MIYCHQEMVDRHQKIQNLTEKVFAYPMMT
nr:MAG TPA: hypothetical protein [Bacteriophage sp.]